MKNKLKGLSALFCLSFVTIMLFVAKRCIFNHIVGMPFVFTGFDAIMPLTGALGFGFAGFLWTLRTLVKFILHGHSLSLLYHIPGLCAAASFAYHNKFISIGLPLMCMILFLVHPIGFASWGYPLYWFIPIVISFSKRSIFLQALLSTFIAHAVGSVICLYTVSTSPVLWWSLMPVVFIERLMFASIMTVVYCGSLFFGKLFSKSTVKHSKVIH